MSERRTRRVRIAVRITSDGEWDSRGWGYEVSEQYVMVTTKDRGVFGGVLEVNEAPKSVVLRDARMCVYWPRDTRGVISLAQDGPGDGARISRAAPRLTLYEITAIAECSDQARERWEAAPWG